MKKLFVLLMLFLLVVQGYSQNSDNKGAWEDEGLARQYWRMGVTADTDVKENASIGDALCYYYWSLVVCSSDAEGSKITIEDPESGETVVMKDWLNDRINVLLGKIDFIPKKKPIMKNRESVVYELVVTDGEDRVPWLKYQYDSGDGIVENTVESGITSVELTDKNIYRFDIKICIENKNEAEAHAEDVYKLMQKLGRPIDFAAAIKSVDVKNAVAEFEQENYHDSTILLKKEVTEELEKEKAVTTNTSDYLRAMKTIEKAVRNKSIRDARACFTEDGYRMISDLLSNGRYYILGTPEYKFLDCKDQVLCRSIPMQFNFNNNVGFIRNVVFRFDKKTCKVSSIAFRLTDVAEIDIMGKDQWKSESRMVLINFLEDYQTAYALKRQEYLESIFSDDALIIVGTVLEHKKQSGDFGILDKATRVRYDTLSKEKYMSKLRNVFSNNEFVNIRFLDTDFTQHKSGAEIYGIQLKQEYLSSRYGDVGYLFLMVDLRDDLPVIHVRTWEPDKTEEPINFDNIVVKMI